ncbi:MAG: hypothetical protein JJU37_11580 [Balneolaceae bacterium]|nr:hypothetical protein [Balneolaceae bacterium]
MKKNTIPFTVTHLENGYTREHGLLHLLKETIRIEFEQIDPATGLAKSGIREIELSFDEIETLAIHKGWFSAQVIVETKSLKTLEGMPGAQQGRCVLKVKRSDTKAAERTISSARVRLSEFRLKYLDDD